jgi:hypothetical protein
VSDAVLMEAMRARIRELVVDRYASAQQILDEFKTEKGSDYDISDYPHWLQKRLQPQPLPEPQEAAAPTP